MKLNFLSLGILLVLCLNTSYAQQEEQVPEFWHLLDEQNDEYRGISLKQAYKLLGKRKSTKVVVAIIDSGIDIEHEDLKGKIWVNKDEKPGNGKDDDKNGYVDDVNGWDFIGGKDGKDVDHDTYEITRLYVKYKAQFEGKSRGDLSENEQKEFDEYQEIKTEFEAKRKELEPVYEQFVQTVAIIEQTLTSVRDHLGKNDFNLEDLNAIEGGDDRLQFSKKVLTDIFTNAGFDSKQLEEQLELEREYYTNEIEYGYNPEFEPRSIVGDEYDNPKDRYYGNNEVRGPDAQHGTHVGGIVAAIRGNDLGAEGIVDNVELMVLRTVPDGDERDKDVANAIRYAVDNGARVINMSFGKAYSPEKELVDEAVRYAHEKGVLLVHASGNEGLNLDEENNFPTKVFLNDEIAENWIEVGASSWGEEGNFVGSFSNYGQTQVDIFAPGVTIYSTVPDQNYEKLQGTSMAAPIVSGVAALLMSYFPKLSAMEVKEIILKSSKKYTQEVNRPGSDGNFIEFNKLSTTGGIVNAYEAVKMAMEFKK